MPAPPAIDGVSASRLQLPPGSWATVLDALCARQLGAEIHYYREVPAEPRLAVEETILHVD